MSFQYDNEDVPFYERFMKDSDYGKDAGIDYTVLSIAVQTLLLILFVEIVKHKLDHAAEGRPFFGTVLHSVYSELSTLGIVELFVYVVLKYYKEYDKTQKDVFADVHFALFYTAVFNAFQTVIVAITTARKSDALWVETEHLELDHYVEIREEFDRVKEKLGYEIEDELTSGWSLKNFPRNIVQSFRNPGLRGHYLDLLVQVNFHSLRLHFLQGNDLPLTLKVSDYLKRSEERVLEKLVHVSGGAWLMLTGCLNLIYFLMGMVAYVSEDHDVVGRFLKGIFFFMLLVFIVISVGLYFKMRRTFRSIITTTFEMDKKRREAGVKRQLELFWFGEPQFVISLIQFMQFGYALALAIVLMYWTSLTTFEPYYFLVAVAVCYGVFVYILSITLPQYTLCTSLGYLVDQKNLRETVGAHRLDEARKLQLQRNAEFNFGDASMVSFETNENSIHQIMDSSFRDSHTSEDSGRLTPAGLIVDSSRASDRNSILAALVKSDTQSLRNLLPEDSRRSLRSREIRRSERKSLSDGVSAMRSFVSKRDLNVSSDDSDDVKSTVDDSAILKREREERAAKRKAQKRALSASSVIQSWQSMTDIDGSSRVGRSDSGIGAAPSLQADSQSRFRSSNDHQMFEAQSTAKTVESDFRDDVVLSPPTMDDSVGDLSDVDVQQWIDSTFVEEHGTPKPSWSVGGVVKYARDYFLGSRYHTLSHVFGSLVAFFLVGHRVEVMLSTTEAIDPSENTWELPLSLIFWMQAGWYAFFIISGAMILSLFLPVQEKSVDQRVLITSTLLDILLSGACLAILFLAEAQRCCDGDELESDTDCCPFWGSRTYGGLGDIEPFTSLIGLRVFRFVVGRYIVEYFDNQSELGVETDGKKKEASDKHSHHGSTSDDSMKKEVGTPLALWEKAISKYPDIVEKYGEFSGELFQAMLGLELSEQASGVEPTRTNTTSPAKSLKLSGTKYATLPPEAQSIIIAGKLGKPVKSMPNLREHRTDLPALTEETDHDIVEAHHSSITRNPTKFEIDNAKVAREAKLQSMFIAPNARLVRSMRRCDRKMLPILTEWDCVDIVMTQFELVYFEALDLKNTSPSAPEHSSLLALQATHGGQGLRLQDIATGRKVVGHFDLSEMTEIHVERSMPLSDASHCKDISALYQGENQLAAEFWADTTQFDKQGGCRQVRWEKVKEDRLRLVSSHGCLVLRFYSDLDDVESHAETSAIESEAQGPLRKNIAFQWAQTVAYICGKETLHQSLPHFGANNSDELRDLLQVANHHEKEHDIAVKNLKSLGGSSPMNNESGPKPKLRRSLSLSSAQLANKEARKVSGKKDGVLDDLAITESIEVSAMTERKTNEISWA